MKPNKDSYIGILCPELIGVGEALKAAQLAKPIRRRGDLFEHDACTLLYIILPIWWYTISSSRSIAVHFSLFFLLCRLVALATERVDAPVAAVDIVRIQVIEIPAQTTKEVLSGFKKDVHLVSKSLFQEIYVLLHVPR